MDRAQTRKTAEKAVKRRVHWHPFFTHFPISLFGVAFLFQVLHFFLLGECLEVATVITFSLGSLAMIPAVLSGWFAWKGRFRGSRARVFKRKIYLGLGMLVLSLGTTGWRFSVFAAPFLEVGPVAHTVYSTVVWLLVGGSLAEGYLGGRLRPR